MRSFLWICIVFVTISCAQRGVLPSESWQAIEKSIANEKLDEDLFGGLPILQGPASESETQLVVLRPYRESFRYYIKSGDQVSRVHPQSEVIKGREYALDHLSVEKGESAVPTFFVFNEQGELRDQREFGFLNPSKSELKILIASCMSDAAEASAQKEIWNRAFQENPDFMLLIGDNVYADWSPEGKVEVTPKLLSKRYTETRLALQAFRQKKLIPTFSVWDDHDYGQNNGTKDFKYKRQVSQLFSQFFPIRPLGSSYITGPGISSKIHLPNLDLILLDNRSFRTEKSTQGGTHFGEDQEAWLFDGMDSKKLNILISGDQWFGGYHPFESFEGDHPENFKTFLGKLKSKSSPVLFISGDRHLSEIIKVPDQALGRKSYEITSSAIHANVYPDAFKKNPSPNQIAGVAGKINYVTLEIPNKNPVKWMRVRSKGQNGKMLFEKRLSIE